MSSLERVYCFCGLKKFPYFYLAQLIPPFLSSFSQVPLRLLAVGILHRGMLKGVSGAEQQVCSANKIKKKKPDWLWECTRWERRLFCAAFDGKSHGSAPTVASEFPPLTTTESTEWLNSEWQQRSEINASKPVSEPQCGNLYRHKKSSGIQCMRFCGNVQLAFLV